MARTSPARPHVCRPALPWRDSAHTECGRQIDDVASTITREQFTDMVRNLGSDTAGEVCTTCYEQALRYPSFEIHPVKALLRDFTPGSAGHPGLADELKALALLVGAHRAEFDGYLSSLAKVLVLDQRRPRTRSGL